MLLVNQAVTPSVADMILHRYVVARVIWTYMLSIAVTYFITLCLFPGLESEIRNVTLGEWLPILIMAIFNISDFVGKVCSLTLWHYGLYLIFYILWSNLTPNLVSPLCLDRGSRAVWMERDSSSLLLVCASSFHPSVHHVCVSGSEAHL